MRNTLAITGTGLYLPPDVRTNDWWPSATVQGWESHKNQSIMRGSTAPPPKAAPKGVEEILASMKATEVDAFRGAVERRVIPKDQATSEIELLAAKRALKSAEVKPHQIDFVLVDPAVPDLLVTNHACTLHERLGLRPGCWAQQTVGTCNGFLLQLQIAEGLIRGGAKCGLLVQSSTFSKVSDYTDPFSAWFGDAASAVVVRPSTQGGLLGMTTITDGSLQGAVGAEGRGTRWYEGGDLTFRPLDKKRARNALLSLVEVSTKTIGRALDKANLGPEDVEFFAGHQVSSWFQEVTQRVCGLVNAKTIDTFPWTGNVAGSNVPMLLNMAQNEGYIRSGTTVAMFGGGAGMTFSAGIVRW